MKALEEGNFDNIKPGELQDCEEYYQRQEEEEKGSAAKQLKLIEIGKAVITNTKNKEAEGGDQGSPTKRRSRRQRRYHYYVFRHNWFLDDMKNAYLYIDATGLTDWWIAYPCLKIENRYSSVKIRIKLDFAKLPTHWVRYFYYIF